MVVSRGQELIRFECRSYSVPARYVKQRLWVRAHASTWRCGTPPAVGRGMCALRGWVSRWWISDTTCWCWRASRVPSTRHSRRGRQSCPRRRRSCSWRWRRAGGKTGAGPTSSFFRCAPCCTGTWTRRAAVSPRARQPPRTFPERGRPEPGRPPAPVDPLPGSPQEVRQWAPAWCTPVAPCS